MCLSVRLGKNLDTDPANYHLVIQQGLALPRGLFCPISRFQGRRRRGTGGSALREALREPSSTALTHVGVRCEEVLGFAHEETWF